MLRPAAVFFLIVMTVCHWPCRADEPPKTIELPSLLVQRIMQALAFEGGTTTAILLRGIDDCLRRQGPMQSHAAGQEDNCPVVTEAIAVRKKPEKAP